MMSRKGDFPREKRECSFRCSWKQSCSSCIDMPNGVIIGVVWNICVAKNATKTGSQCRHRSRLEGDMYKIHSLEYSHLYIKLVLNTFRLLWVRWWSEGWETNCVYWIPSTLGAPATCLLAYASWLALLSVWRDEWCIGLPQTSPCLGPLPIKVLQSLVRLHCPAVWVWA